MHLSNRLHIIGTFKGAASASKIDDRFQFLIYECSVSFLLYCLYVHGFLVLWIGGTSKKFFSRFYKNVRTIFFRISVDKKMSENYAFLNYRAQSIFT
jgi:hypothetical protein